MQKSWKTFLGVAVVGAISLGAGSLSAEPPVGGCGDIVHGTKGGVDWHGGPGFNFSATWFISNFSNTHTDDRQGIANLSSGESTNPPTHEQQCGA
ncbi:MAG TPA: hypothetical protein VF035_10580 [Longimicrobiales bacterium]